MPSPTWIKLDEVLIPEAQLARSASLIESQLGPQGIELVGGSQWWQWRRPEIPLKAEWIEMRADYNERKARGQSSERIILYVHGGAYYFGSVDEHRYQMQRHARKLKARCLAPRYRLAPQFPFPCGLHDCIATYLYLIETHDPSSVLLAGDSAGGGMVISMLVILRDQGIPLPAGALLLSPWVDLTHSFPSLAADASMDYIPPNGFHHRPSVDWPPPNATDLKSLGTGNASATKKRVASQPPAPPKDKAAEVDAARGFSVKDDPASPDHPDKRLHDAIPGPGRNLSIEVDGKIIEIEDQIQMYAANHLLAHPLVSPVMQPSLGGLPPLLIQVGGGELLRDEQIYLAHKAANPSAYPPPDAIINMYDPQNELLHKYPPTHVQLQVWDDLCHVPHTLSFTRPAKFMYRSVAQFGAWALAAKQQRPVAIMDDDEISIISNNHSQSDASQHEEDDRPSTSATLSFPPRTGNLDVKNPEATRPVSEYATRAQTSAVPSGAVGRAGDPLPPFENNMIRQRVDRHGNIYPLSEPSELPSLHVDRNSIGVIKPGPVRKWMAKKTEWDTRYAKEKRSVQKTRLKEMKEGYDGFDGETPPPTALAGRRRKRMEKQKVKKGKSWGLAMWSGWGSKHDEATVERRTKLLNTGRRPTHSVILPEAGRAFTTTQGEHEDDLDNAEPVTRPATIVSSAHEDDVTSSNGASDPEASNRASRHVSIGSAGMGAEVPASHESIKVPGSDNTYLNANNPRPHNGTVAYPFKLRNMPAASLSTATLDSSKDMIRPIGTGERPGTAWRKQDDAASFISSRNAPGSWVDGASSGSPESKMTEVRREDSASGGSRESGGPLRIASMQSQQRHLSTGTVQEELNNKDDVEEKDSDDGHEIGGHKWILPHASTRKQSQSWNQNENASRPATATTTVNSTDKGQQNEIGGHDWFMEHAKDHGGNAYNLNRERDSSSFGVGSAVVENGGVHSADRPPLNTFVTAREELDPSFASQAAVPTGKEDDIHGGWQRAEAAMDAESTGIRNRKPEVAL